MSTRCFQNVADRTQCGEMNRIVQQLRIVSCSLLKLVLSDLFIPAVDEDSEGGRFLCVSQVSCHQIMFVKCFKRRLLKKTKNLLTKGCPLSKMQ